MKQEQTENNMSRKDFLRTTLFLGAAMGGVSMGGISEAKVGDASEKCGAKLPVRTLGTGNAALSISALGFGVMGMNHHRGVLVPDRKSLVRLLHEAVDHGVTLFDTAEIYGPFTNEELAGEALSEFRGKIAVTTKFGFDFANGVPTGKRNSRPERIRQVAEESLRRLKVDAIELFYQHRFDPEVPVEDVAGTVKELIQEGKVKRFGLCEVSASTIRRAHAIQPVTAIQSEYHLMWREPEKEILPVCEELGIGFVPYSPVNRGLLTGTLNEYTNFRSGNDNRADLPRFQPEAIRQNLRFVEAVTEFGRTRGMTSAQVSLAWLLAKKPWIVPIPGTTKISHLEENLRTLDFTLSATEVEELETRLAEITIIGDRYPAEQQQRVER
ncbi:MAG: aldo/keto reductase [Planctomycetia bacterium]|nr:aldo/keto reductase [Planctomycetia bacterium]